MKLSVSKSDSSRFRSSASAFCTGGVLKLGMVGLWLAGCGLNAATYYIRKDGNNANLGTANTAGGAWLTIQKAANSMVAGDTAVVGDGTYSETVTTGADGTSGSRVVFQAQSTNAVVTSFVVSKSYNTISGFTITGESTTIDASVLVTTGGNYLNLISNVFQSSQIGVYQLYAYAYGINVRNITAAGNRFLNGWGHAVALTSGGGHVISNNFFSSPNGYDAFRIAATNITIVGNTFTNWNNAFLTSGPLKVGAKYYFEGVGGNPNFSNVGAGPGPYLLGEAYVFTATGTTPLSWGTAVLANANHPDIIQAFQLGAVGTVPPDYPSWDLVFERNLVINCNGGVQIGNIEDNGKFGNINRWTFRNNLFVRISNTMNLFAPGFSFCNNTFYQCGSNSGGVLVWNATDRGVSSNLTFYNNILSECGTASSPYNGWYGGDPALNQVKDYNLVVGTGAGTTKSGFSELHSINGSNPLFVNAAMNDFHLQAGSPAIGVGTNLSSRFTTDFTGSTRGANWSMGAYAFQSGTSTGTPVIAISPPSLDFGSVSLGTSLDQTLNVQNSGSGTLSGSATVGAPFSILSGGSYSLGAGQSQSVMVRYAPTAAGTSQQNVTFTGAAGDSVAVTGMGVAVTGATYYVVCEGDSITAGNQANPQALSNYVAQLALQLPGVAFQNIGKSGDAIEYNVTPWIATYGVPPNTNTAYDAINHFAAALGYTKRTAVFQMGNNDIAVNDSVTFITNNIGLWLAAVRAAYPDVKIVGMTLTACNYGAASNPTYQPRLTALNAALRNSVPFDYLVDLAADPRLSDYTDTRYFSTDQVHPNNSGYAVIADLVKAVLIDNGRASLGGETKPESPLNLRVLSAQ